MNPLIIEVTYEDIAKGCKASPQNCPVARATMRAAMTDQVSVGARHMYIRNLRYRLPDQVEGWIERYDTYPLQFTAPIKFIVDLDDYVPQEEVEA